MLNILIASLVILSNGPECESSVLNNKNSTIAFKSSGQCVLAIQDIPPLPPPVVITEKAEPKIGSKVKTGIIHKKKNRSHVCGSKTPHWYTTKSGYRKYRCR